MQQMRAQAAAQQDKAVNTLLDLVSNIRPELHVNFHPESKKWTPVKACSTQTWDTQRLTPHFGALLVTLSDACLECYSSIRFVLSPIRRLILGSDYHSVSLKVSS